MKKDVQKTGLEGYSPSPFAQEKTYGEKKYDLIFGTMIDFWVNLFASAGFGYFAFHSQSNFKIPGLNKIPFVKELEFIKNPKPLYQTMDRYTKWLSETPLLRTIKNDQARFKRAETMSSLLTLLTPGHFILIPSVWLGDKIKPAFVRALDRKHYGAEAMENPDLKARHEAIELGDRHTLLGALVGRMGAVIATQTVARTLGDESNWANSLGEKIHNPMLQKFGGLDPFAARIGEAASMGIDHVTPNISVKVDEFARKHNMGWSTKQINNPNIDTSGQYRNALQHFSRYLAMDVLYTYITAATIRPIIDFGKKFIPGLTYKPAPKPGMDLDAIAQIQLPKQRTFRDETNVIEDGAAPDLRVSNITRESTLKARPEQVLAHAGN